MVAHMRLPARLHRNRHGVFGFRIVLPWNTGRIARRREIRITLGTRDPATAKARFNAHRGQFLLMGRADVFRGLVPDQIANRRRRGDRSRHSRRRYCQSGIEGDTACECRSCEVIELLGEYGVRRIGICGDLLGNPTLRLVYTKEILRGLTGAGTL